MSSTYLGEGILLLSQLNTEQCTVREFRKSKKENLEKHFEEFDCMPWIPRNHIKVEISLEQWKARRTIEYVTLEDEIQYPRFEFEDDTVITILDGVARIEVARSSKSQGCEKLFGIEDLQSRWWVVDFERKTHLPLNIVRHQGRHATVRSLLDAKDSDLKSIRTDCAVLTASQYRDLRLALNVVPKEAFAPLHEYEQLWPDNSLGMWSRIRKSKFKEEITNLIEHVRVQYSEITLNWDPLITTVMDHKSIQLLQSRAPCISRNDHEYVTRNFDNGIIFPKLTRNDLRQRVKAAVCKQGIIMTMKTVGKDIGVLDRAWRPLIDFLKPERKRHKSSRNSILTVRRVLEGFFERQFVRLWNSCSLRKSVVPATERLEYSQRCYWQVFLYMMRNDCSKISIRSEDLEVLAENEFKFFYDKDITVQSGLLIEAASSPRQITNAHDPFDNKDVNIASRHGPSLFKHRTANDRLHLDGLRKAYQGPSFVSLPFLQQELVHIFLFGVTSISLPSRPLAVAKEVQMRSTKDNLNQSSLTTSQARSFEWSEEVNSRLRLSETRRFAEMNHHGNIFKSMVAPIAYDSQTTSLAAGQSSVNTTYRLPFGSQTLISNEESRFSELDSEIEENYRSEAPRLTNIHYPGTAVKSMVASITHDSRSTSPCTSYRLPFGVEFRNPETKVVASPAPMQNTKMWPKLKRRLSDAQGPLEKKRQLLSQTRSRQSTTSQSPTILNSSSIYSVPPTAPALIDEGNPCAHRSFQANFYRSLMTTANPYLIPPLSRSPITFRSMENQHLYHRIPSDTVSIERFAENQMKLAPSSAFWYSNEGGYRKMAANCCELVYAFSKYKFETVLVSSGVLASTCMPPSQR